MTRMDASVSTPPSRRWRRGLGLLAATTAVIGAAVGLRFWMGSEPASAQSPPAARSAQGPTAEGGRNAATSARPTDQDPVAIVNGQAISRKLLLDACVRLHGEEVLESMANKQLIQYHCKNRGIQIAHADVDAEIDRMAQRFKLSRKQWLEMLMNERGITPEQYARDIVWPTIALRKLAAKQLTVTQEDLERAYQSQYGPAVRARLIVLSDPQMAQQVHARVTAHPDDFARLAMDHSEDVNSASIGGLIQPIRRHVGDPAIEQAVFGLQDGQVSPVIQVANQYVILKSEGRLPARNVALAQVQNELAESIKEEKLREEANVLFARLQESATIKNVYNDPQLSKQMPGVVATVNGDQITYRQLAEECFARHADEVLQIEISQALLRQELIRQRIEVKPEDLQAEIVHAATISGIVNEKGEPDLEKWMHMATTDRNMTRDQYVRDSVWPSVALKKLTSDQVQVTHEDLHKAFEANYGEKVRCQAIVLGSHRRAQEVWEMARRNPTEEAFGDLAAEFSIEPSTKSLRGEVPPIRRHGGRDKLEDAAFALQPGQLSSIIQLADKFIILRCLGRTEPLDVQFEAVSHILHQDIYEKKLRQAMSERFEALQESAKIENRLTGKSKAGASQSAQSAATGQPHRDPAVRTTSGTPGDRPGTIRR